MRSCLISSVDIVSILVKMGGYCQSLHFKLIPETTERRVKVMEINVSFDEQGRVRVLDADKYEQTKQLQDQCSGFSASTFLMVVG
jgi:hypothetical protein